MGQLDRAAEEIRGRVCRYGMAVGWHLAKARRMIRDREWAETKLAPEAQEAFEKHFAELPHLIACIETQDRMCHESWTAGRSGTDGAHFLTERDRLVELLIGVQFMHREYERAAMQSEWRHAEQARRLSREPRGASVQAIRELEDAARMPLEEYMGNEEGIGSALKALDAMRAELVDAYRGWALKLVGANDGRSEVLAEAAVQGLSRAVIYYDHRRGYRFKTYARWWIKDRVARAGGPKGDES